MRINLTLEETKVCSDLLSFAQYPPRRYLVSFAQKFVHMEWVYIYLVIYLGSSEASVRICFVCSRLSSLLS